jgi:hypothetical protein
MALICMQAEIYCSIRLQKMKKEKLKEKTGDMIFKI